MSNPYVFWGAHSGDEFLLLDGLEGFEDGYRMNFGIKLASEFPPDAFFPARASSPNNTIPTDTLDNMSSFLVVSDRCRSFLTGYDGLGMVEFLPVEVRNHKNKPLKDKYFIVNPLEFVEVFDEKESAFRLDKSDQTEEFGTLQLREKAFEGAPLILRPRHMTKMIMVSRKLKEAMEKEGFIGNKFAEIEWLQAEGRVPPGPSSLAAPIELDF